MLLLKSPTRHAYYYVTIQDVHSVEMARWHNLLCESDGAESPPTLWLDLAETSAERGIDLRAKQRANIISPHTHADTATHTAHACSVRRQRSLR